MLLNVSRWQSFADCLEDGSRDVPLEELTVTDPDDDVVAIGKMKWRRDTGEVVHLWVHADHRRRGIATYMWQIAKAEGATHSEWRTKDGQAWALSLGEPLPKWRLA